MIYDTARRYGLGCNRKATREIRIESKVLSEFEQDVDGQEHLCQVLRQRYHDAATIQSRNNPVLHRRQLPRRYWRYLTERNSKRRNP